MKTITTGLLALAAATGATAGTAHAQPPAHRFAVEAHGGGALPQGRFGDGMEAGFTAGASVTFQPTGAVGLYAAYEHSRFRDAVTHGLRVRDQGFSAGVRIPLPTDVLPIDPHVRVGIIRHSLGLDGGSEALEAIEFHPEYGFEAGLGVGIPVTPRLQVAPALTYAQFSADFENENGQAATVDVKSLRLDVGLRLSL